MVITQTEGSHAGDRTFVEVESLMYVLNGVTALRSLPDILADRSCTDQLNHSSFFMFEFVSPLLDTLDGVIPTRTFSFYGSYKNHLIVVQCDPARIHLPLDWKS